MKKKRILKLNIPVVIVCGIIFLAMIITLFFNEQLNYAFHLKPNLTEISNNSLQVHFMDTGEGDAILVKLPNDKTIIIDSGRDSYRDKLTYYIDNVFFNGSKNKVFDYAILTHSDSDHTGNFLHILNRYKINNFYRPKIYSINNDKDIDGNVNMVINDTIYDAIIDKLNTLESENRTKVFYNFVGAETDELKPYLTFLTPTKNSYDSPNKYSPIIKLTFNNKTVVLTGDATVENEIEMINSTERFTAEVVKLGHHGSKTSTSSTFLEFLNPKYAVISCGQNDFGHPNEEVLNNLKNQSEELFNNTYSTQNKGNIIYYINDDGNSDFMFIKNVSSYIFIDYYFIAIGVMGLCLLIIFFPKYEKKDNKK